MEEDVDLRCNSLQEEDVDLRYNSIHPQVQVPDDPLHDRDSQYASGDSLYPVPF
jgi:hypothetical protein